MDKKELLGLLEENNINILKRFDDNNRFLGLSEYTEIFDIFNNYLEDAQEKHIKYMNRYLASTLNKYITGLDDFSKDPMHVEYIENIKQAVAKYENAIANCKDEQIIDLTNQNITKLLLKPVEKELKYINIVMIADDIYCINLLDSINKEKLNEIYLEFTKNYPIMLENQEKVKTKFESLLGIKKEKKFSLKSLFK